MELHHGNSKDREALLVATKLQMHLNKAWAHRDLYVSNWYRSECFFHECISIMDDKIDHAKTASLIFSHKTKHLDGLTKLPLSVTGMLAHRHGDVRYAHYRMDLYPHDANYIVGLCGYKSSTQSTVVSKFSIHSFV